MNGFKLTELFALRFIMCLVRIELSLLNVSLNAQIPTNRPLLKTLKTEKKIYVLKHAIEPKDFAKFVNAI